MNQLLPCQGIETDMENVDRIMQQGVRDGIFPGGVLCVWAHDKVVFHRAYGVADIRSNSPVTTGTVFDLASLTKPLATAPAVLKLVDMGRLSATSLLCDVLPAFRETEKSDIAISMLLCHTSGLPAHREYFRQLSAVPEGQRNSALLRMLKDEPLVYRPGSRVVYSDLGYMLLRFVVERAVSLPVQTGAVLPRPRIVQGVARFLPVWCMMTTPMRSAGSTVMPACLAILPACWGSLWNCSPYIRGKGTGGCFPE
ncbi:MAG: hypothetical protein B5M56_00475 [Desulfococcus sp. 4484_241]|nr:MAG: hypothetical protein B5M56_00475 [Desulfococcus sp. 4484_241]